jgi:hypothetical protein
MFHIKDLASSLGYEIVDYVVKKSNGNLSKSSDYHVRTLQQTVDYLLEKHQSQFTDMNTKIIETGAICETFVAVADELFMDRQCNWARIATVYAAAASLAACAASNHDDTDLVKKIGGTVGNYVAANLANWIHKNGGWVRK